QNRKNYLHLMKFEFFVALRYLRAKRKQSFGNVIASISMLGVAVGVAALIVAMGVMNGFSTDFRDRILGINAEILVQGFTQDSERIRDELLAIPGVKAATPHLYTELMISTTDKVKGVLLRGIDVETAPTVITALQKLEPGVLESLAPYQPQAGDGAGASAGADADGAGAIPASGSAANAANDSGADGANPDSTATIPADEADAEVRLQESEWQQALKQNPKIPRIIIGKQLARRMGIHQGQRIHLLAPAGTQSSAGYQPRIKPFMVAGFFDTGMADVDLYFAFTGIHAARDMMGIRGGEWISGFEMTVHDIYAADKVAELIRDKIGDRFDVYPWMETNPQLMAALKLEALALGIVLVLLIAVGSFSIITTLIMLVMDKTKDIAIMMSMGATSGSIRKIFMLQGVIIGVAGTAVGFALGLGICFLLKRYKFIKLPPGAYLTDYVPVLIEWGELGLIAAGTVFICFLATLYPAHQAAKLVPVEALRSE
ncbi:ABC transporter permease, partial [Desulfovibrio sp. OttesenSCG-928-C06]|nr:ABC transporter permease [Desulfovibrio sp. OttesenSCG-928-C06]